jgi:hypothetical protein
MYMFHEVFNLYFPIGFYVAETHSRLLPMDVWGPIFWCLFTYEMYQRKIFITIWEHWKILLVKILLYSNSLHQQYILYKSADPSLTKHKTLHLFGGKFTNCLILQELWLINWGWLRVQNKYTKNTLIRWRDIQKCTIFWVSKHVFIIIICIRMLWIIYCVVLQFTHLSSNCFESVFVCTDKKVTTPLLFHMSVSIHKITSLFGKYLVSLITPYWCDCKVKCIG